MALEWSPIVNIAPQFPDIFECDVHYGAQLHPADCIQAAGRLPTGSSPVPYTIGAINHPPDWNTSPTDLPYMIEHNNCEIWVEVLGGWEQRGAADPRTVMRGRVSLVPDLIRGLVGHLIAACVTPSSRGGFATAGLANMITYILQPETYPPSRERPMLPSDLQPFPQDALFFTVTVHDTSGVGHPDVPNMEPSVPIALATGLRARRPSIISGLDNLEARTYVMRMEAELLRAVIAMEGQGGAVPWWDTTATTPAGENTTIPTSSEGPPTPLPPPNNAMMSYQCSSSSSFPLHAADCAQIEYSQLGAPSDSVALAAGTARIFVSNTCRVVVEASVAMMLAWSQVRVALETLVDVCVSPGSKGGKAFYGVQSDEGVTDGLLFGRSREEGRGVSGLDALPPHVNVTVEAVGG
ncbi:hypothetical protein MMC14_009784 [Varicellaria rhodocarpa]|nr:hypothetical protein [Varicellaria rhodocarpa]